jgi:Fe-S-cluster-containing dehydrogenase component
MKKWNLVIDVADCTNCNLCTLATMDEYIGNDWPGYAAPMPKHGHRWMEVRTKERGQVPFMDVGYLPVTCNHCDDAPCVKAAKDGAAYKRPDGIVIIDPEKAKGQRQIVESCPYGAVWWNEERQAPQIWPFDAHLLDQGWTETRGAQSCPTRAMQAICVEDDEMRRMAAEQELEVLKPELGTRPRVWYRNLWRFTKAFIGGSVSAEANGVVDCVEGASVRLTKDGRLLAQAATDNYGDFRFDRLDENSGDYTVEIEAAGKAKKALPVRLGESLYLGEIRL